MSKNYTWYLVPKQGLNKGNYNICKKTIPVPGCTKKPQQKAGEPSGGEQKQGFCRGSSRLSWFESDPGDPPNPTRDISKPSDPTRRDPNRPVRCGTPPDRKGSDRDQGKTLENETLLRAMIHPSITRRRCCFQRIPIAREENFRQG